MSLQRNLVSTISTENVYKSIVYSPVSVQSCLLIASLGAAGKTANEMQSVLNMGSGSRQSVAKNYIEFVRDSINKSSEGDKPVLKIANNIFVNNQLSLIPEFCNIAEKRFDTKVKEIDFNNKQAAVREINSVIQKQTQNKVQNILQPEDLDKATSIVLVNAVYFKGFWLKQFSDNITHRAPFYWKENGSMEVDMMCIDERYKYIDLPKLAATAVEMPFANSELSMMIILPNKISGIAYLEKHLAKFDFNEISSKMEPQLVSLFLPRLTIEFDIDLKSALQKLGMKSMFDTTANFESMTESRGSIKQIVSVARHKAYLEIDETGTKFDESEKGGTKTTLRMFKSTSRYLKMFRVDHPFVFVIRDSKAIYIAGHYVGFSDRSQGSNSSQVSNNRILATNRYSEPQPSTSARPSISSRLSTSVQPSVTVRPSRSSRSSTTSRSSKP